MPFDYDPNVRAYRNQGRLVSRSETRFELEKLIDQVSQEAANLAGQYESGAIEIGEFETGMRALLKAGHISAAAVGRGGVAQMEQSDWQQVAAKIRWQFQYLEKFANKLKTGRLEKAYSKYRARSYSSALYVSYSNGRAAAEKEFIDGGGKGPDGSKIQCRLVQSSQEGCVECSADADEGWMDPDDLDPIGSRICGDWCLCVIEFSDEVDE